MRHTPAPWYDDGYRIYGPTDEEDKRSGRCIMEYKHTDDFNAADAPLIRAAPELLYACQLAYQIASSTDEEDAVAWPEVLDVLKTAIAAAVGGK